MINDDFLLFGEKKGCFVHSLPWNPTNHHLVNEESPPIILLADGNSLEGGEQEWSGDALCPDVKSGDGTPWRGRNREGKRVVWA